MAQTYAGTIVNDKGKPIINAKCEAYRVDTGALVETVYTNTSGVYTFSALIDNTDHNIKATWGSQIRWWHKIFGSGINGWRVIASDDFEATSAGKGIICKTPDGTKRYRIAISNEGAVTATLL